MPQPTRRPGWERAAGRAVAAMVMTAFLSGFCYLGPDRADATRSTARIAVFTLFKPVRLVVQPELNSTVVLQAGREQFLLEGSQRAILEENGPSVICSLGARRIQVESVEARARDGQARLFTLSVPGKICRTFEGTLEVRSDAGMLVPVVSMQLETAVASAVAAELTGDTPFEALKAQAVATRSYYAAAAHRHHGFDFCDTTHCQFLRQAPRPADRAYAAAVATRGLVLVYERRVVPAMFSASCGGQTRIPDEVGLPDGAYPYFQVPCPYCAMNAARWSRRLSVSEAEELVSRPQSEISRLSLGRKLGWQAVPGNYYRLRREWDGMVIEGRGSGHGVGLCQQGAAASARSGRTFAEILAYYYPATSLVSLNR